MSEMLKCACGSCGAKYRLPAEFAGRSARCKKCGEKFAVPKSKSVEDSVLDWLRDEDEDEVGVDQPRVITMPKSKSDDSDAARKLNGPIRIKAPAATAAPSPKPPAPTAQAAQAKK